MTTATANKTDRMKQLREEWQKSKELADGNKVLEAAYREAGLNISYWSFVFVQLQMQAQGFDGIPYVDCKTYRKWKEAGFQVRKGETSRVDGIVWRHPSVKNADGEYVEDTDSDYIFPHLYRLFHTSQVDPI